MVTPDILQKAVGLAEKLQYALIGTADGEGFPHIAIAGKIELNAAKQLAATYWFCPGTINNLNENRKISIVVWDPASDIGYQIFGDVKTVEDQAYLDGYSLSMEDEPRIPQVERKLIVQPGKVAVFSRAPHSDEEA